VRPVRHPAQQVVVEPREREVERNLRAVPAAGSGNELCVVEMRPRADRNLYRVDVRRAHSREVLVLVSRPVERRWLQIRLGDAGRAGRSCTAVGEKWQQDDNRKS
jgi:hypothetical protein